MDNHNKKRFIIYSGIAAIALATLFVVGLIISYFIGKAKEAIPDMGSDEIKEVYMTPAQIQSIRHIGEWEFLSIKDEEMVDSTRPGYLFDNHLVRIYYGTLRFGIDLSKVESEDFIIQGETLTAHLPKAGLLDNNFIDEARTKSFHETGKWSNNDRNDLYLRAQAKMTERCVTPEIIGTTQRLAKEHLEKIFQAMGYQHVIIYFDKH